MPSFQAKFIKTILRFQPYRWAQGSIQDQRSRQERSAKMFPIPRNVEFHQINIDELAAEWIEPAKAKRGVILYLHGGAYALGSVNIHREYLARLASVTERKILAINYRLAPENPFPAALEDSLKAYRWLISQGYPPTEIALAGDSAGGGLALSMLISLRNEGEELPACAVCLSPWTDLTLSGDSIKGNAKADPILNSIILENYARYYVRENEAINPLISPLFADLKGLPPLFIHVGTSEILLDDATRLAKKAVKAGVKVKLETWEGLFHVFQIVPMLPETKRCLDQIYHFLVEYIP
jgi:monoterpene epsilon-lactone hydrolase